MEARAINRYIGTSPRKMRLVIDLIRGRGVEEALTVLHFSPKHAARAAEKVLRSAISNFQNKDEAGRVDLGQLFVKEAFVNGGPMLKRIMPAPMGRAYRIQKRSNHITIVVAQRTKGAAPAAKAKSHPEKTEQAAEAPTPKKTAKKSAASGKKKTATAK